MSGKIFEILADFADFQVEEKPKNNYKGNEPQGSGLKGETYDNRRNDAAVRTCGARGRRAETLRLQ